jgi:hypothetical protein
VKTAECHPNRLHKAKGLCGACYEKHLRDTRPQYREKVDNYYSQWREKNKEKVQQYKHDRHLRQKEDPTYRQRARSRRLKNKYGITAEEYATMLNAQGGGCKLCFRAPGSRPLHVDHCHTTGVVRGLLCHQCNWYLGTVDKDPGILNRITAYREAAQ